MSVLDIPNNTNKTEEVAAYLRHCADEIEAGKADLASANWSIRIPYKRGIPVVSFTVEMIAVANEVRSLEEVK